MTLYGLTRPFRKVKRLIDWIPVLWKTEDWDYAYALEIWVYSLRRLRHCLETGISKNRSQDVKNIRTCEILLKRIADDNYLEHEWNKFFEKYPITWDNKGLVIDKTKVVIHSQKQSGELEKLAEQEEYLMKQDMEHFCNIFKKHVRSFWD